MRILITLLVLVLGGFSTILPAATDTVISEPPPAPPQEQEEGLQPFGSRLFTGNFLKTREDGLNPNYVVAPGDQVSVRTWGAVNLDDTYTVDGQGNIFLPEIGPLHLEGVMNGDLTDAVRGHIRTVYIDNIDVYTNLVTSQPVAVYVTGLVNNPGRYAGIPSDSILFFLDQAGGIDAELGSYRRIEILRNEQPIASIDLYDFLLKGRISTPQLQDNDTILVSHRGPVIELGGNVAHPALVELASESATGADVLAVIPGAARATEVTLVGMRSGEPFNQTLSLEGFRSTGLRNGDSVTLRDDGRAGTILVSIEGEYEGPSVLSVKRGARLVDVLNHIPVNQELANVEAVYIRRKSVAHAQKDAIGDSLFRLERSTLLALSGSSNEVNIRVQEAKLVEIFAEKARLIDPLGRVVTSQDGVQQNILMEPDDTIVIPGNTQIVRVAGEVLMMQAVTYREGWTATDYIGRAGSYTERADTSKIILHRQNAAVEIIDPDRATIKPGDEILVPPRVDKKWRQFGIDMLDVVYKVAISAKVVMD
jgi:protein involved in polysaccharide export with SLBB domain